MSTKVQYVVDGKVSTVWNRIASSKVTWVVIGFLAMKAEAAFPQEAFSSYLALKAAMGSFLPVAMGGVAAILFRSVVAKAELAANASNPMVVNVEAVETNKPGNGAINTAIVAGGLTAFVGLSGCSAGSKLGEIVTNPDGKPIIAGEVCVNTANGKFCYIPNEPVIVEPETKPETVAQVTAAPINTAPLTMAPVEKQLIPVPARTLEK